MAFGSSNLSGSAVSGRGSAGDVDRRNGARAAKPTRHWLKAAAVPLLIVAAASQAAPAWARISHVAGQLDSGFSAERLAALDKMLAERVAKGDMAGSVVVVARHGAIVHTTASGMADIASGRRMTDDTIFRAYSMTKPVAAVALMMLYERGLFQLDEPIAKYLPEFKDVRVLKTLKSPLTETVPADRPPTIHDLMRHTAGLGHGWGDDAVNTEYRKQDIFGNDVTMKAMSEKIGRIPLLFQPGTMFNYAVGADVEARLVEVLSGKPFDVFLNDELFKPLGMTSTGFWVDPSRISRLATVYWRKDDKLVPIDQAHGSPPNGGFLTEPWSVNSYARNNPRKGGSYGLVTTAGDYWRFSQMLLNRGTFGGRRLLSPATVDFIAEDHLPAKAKATFGPGLGQGLGVAVVEDAAATGGVWSDGTYFWSGAANTHFWIDPKTDTVVVAMTQDMANPADSTFRDQVKSMVYGAMIH